MWAVAIYVVVVVVVCVVCFCLFASFSCEERVIYLQIVIIIEYCVLFIKTFVCVLRVNKYSE